MNRRTALIGAGVAAATAASALTVTAVAGGGGPAGEGRGEERGIILAEGADRHPAQTAQDWVTYADHAVVVTALGEKAVEPATDDPDDPDDQVGPVLRKVTLRVDRVLWSADDPAHTAPTVFEWDAYGWHQDEDGQRVEMSGHNEPRIEPGHSYVMALEWEPPQCPAGDDPTPGRWRGLGDESAIPYDDRLLGQGEFQGQPQTVEQARADAEQAASTGAGTLGALPEGEPEYILRNELTGHSADELAQRLATARPAPAAQQEERGAAAAQPLASEECA
ncbi:hypothetical protein [Streptomyces sp. NPDC093094]|uniref:hypothetical protein n=1 Tax=Streptomyces sp. NPDC093094 TaxID=3366026 RepID=UPI003804BA01